MNITEAIRSIIAGLHLSEDQAAAVATEIMSGSCSDAQIAALLIALRMKGEAVDEIVGFARAMREGAEPIKTSASDLVDTCGTGGDGTNTFNISTVAAFVAAGAGCKIAKHGNRSISSQCGSADVLAQLGVNIQMEPEHAAACMAKIGVGFLFAPQYHPGARHAAGPRKEVGVRTIFNMLGPLLNPAGARRQVMGVYARALTEPIAHVLRRLGSTHCLVVHGKDGLDELSLSGPTDVAELKDGEVRTFVVTPEECGLKRADLDSIRGGAADENAQILRAILAGAEGPKRDVVLLNAAGAIYVAGRAATLREGVTRAAESIDSGRAQAALEALIEEGRR